ncbi:MAG: hypothetical protein AAGK02_07530 [Pseudomonadota bacterium]
MKRLTIAAAASTVMLAASAPASAETNAPSAAATVSVLMQASGPKFDGMTTKEVNGRNLKAVRFATGRAAFVETSEGVWQEYDRQGNPSFRFEETGRDDWSVYMIDRGRNVRMQLDVHRKMVRISQNGAQMADYHAIRAAFAPGGGGGGKFAGMRSDSVNGGNLSGVSFASGNAAFVQMGGGQWQEYNGQGQPSFSFRETHRDEWSVYLVDEGRNVRIQLDVHRKMTRIGQNGGAMSDYQKINRVYRKR